MSGYFEGEYLSRPPSPHGSTTSWGLVDDSTIAMQIRKYLDDWHYRMLNTGMTRSWDRKKVVTCALQFLEIYGVDFGYDDVSRVAAMDEPDLIQRILSCMPEECKFGFDQFTFQMQILLANAGRLRKALDRGDDNEVHQALRAVEGSGLDTAISKQAALRFVQEICDGRVEHEGWRVSTEERMRRLVSFTEKLLIAERDLAHVEVTHAHFKPSQNFKAQKVLGTLARHNDLTLIGRAWKSWANAINKRKRMQTLQESYNQQIESVERELHEFRQSQINNVRNVLMRQCAGSDEELLSHCVTNWCNDVQEQKAAREGEAKKKALEDKLSTYSKEQAARTKDVMLRMASDSDAELQSQCLQALMHAVELARAARALEAETRKKEAEVNEYLSRKQEEARHVLARMAGDTESGVLTSAWAAWVHAVQEGKKARESEEKLKDKEQRFRSFMNRQKANAQGVMTRVTEQQKLECLLQHFCAWVLDTKTERLERRFAEKLHSNKSQLASVQSMFRDFATQLEAGISVTPRDHVPPMSKKRSSTVGSTDRRDSRDPYCEPV